ncbi:MAG: mechanosensitive ion channel family protein [bacterium]
MALEPTSFRVACAMKRANLLAALCAVLFPLALAMQVQAGTGNLALVATTDGGEKSAVAEEKLGPPERNQETPRNAVYDFLMLAREGNWKAASTHLEAPAGGWPEGESPERIARALKTILDTRLWIDLDAVPDERTGEGDLDAEGRVSLGEVATEDAAVEINLVRTKDEWYFAPETVAAVPVVARGIGSWWTTALPSFFSDVRLAEIELWQWIGLALIAIVGVLAGMFVSRTLRSGADSGALRSLGIVAPTVGAIATPVGFLLSFIAMRLAEGWLALSIPARENLSLGLRAATIFVIAWAVVRWIRAMSVILEKKLEARGIAEAVGIVRIGRVIAAALVYLLGASAALQIFGLDLSAVIAGLGIGTAALALASQQTLGNLFGGASVLADRVLKPGDTVNIGGTIGTVERIGIRSTQVRTLDRTLLVVANGDLAQSRVEKMSERDAFRLSAVLGLRYETTASQMRAIVGDIRTLLENDAMVDAASVRVHFLVFNNSSLDIDIKALIQTDDAAKYRETLERFNLSFMEIIARHGSGFAFPSQTVYLARDSAPRG